MATHSDKIKENISQSVANTVSQRKINGDSTFQFVDSRHEAISERKLQEMATNSSQAMQLRAVQEMADNSQKSQLFVQLKSGEKFAGKTIQLRNMLTMHAAPLDTRLAGGGAGSAIDTGAEIAAVIASNNLTDLNDSRTALRRSIIVRQSAPNPDAPHLARIVQEQGWLGQLDAAIAPLEAARLASRQQMLMGPRPPQQPGPGWTPPPGPVWGKK